MGITERAIDGGADVALVVLTTLASRQHRQPDHSSHQQHAHHQDHDAHGAVASAGQGQVLPYALALTSNTASLLLGLLLTG